MCKSVSYKKHIRKVGTISFVYVSVKGQKQISRKTIGVGGTALTKSKKIMGLFAPKTTHNQGTSATGSGLQGSSQAHSNKSEKVEFKNQNNGDLESKF